MSSKKKTTELTEEATSTLVPKLRFLAFRDSPSWRLESLSKFVASLDAGVSVNAGDRPATAFEIGVLKTSCVTNGVFELVENKVVLDPDEQGRVAENVRAGTIIISRMNTIALVGANAYVENDVDNIFLPDRLWAAKPTPGSNLRFIAHVLGSDRGRAALSELAAGSSGSMKNISKSAVLELLFPAPGPDEQQIIADCLSSVDELIAAQSRKVEGLKTHKKGLMQQLFPREGETQPPLRFPEFRMDGEWEISRLSELIDLISGVHLSPDHYKSTIGEVPYFTGPSDFTNEIRSVTKWTTRTANVAHVGDTLITVKGSGVGEIWYSTLPEVAMGRQLMAIRVRNGSNQFVFQFLLTKRTRFEDLGSGNLIPGLSRAAILEMEVCFPRPAEQERIASCLSSLDALITAETRKLDAVKAHKRGLMLQLFPSLERV